LAKLDVAACNQNIDRVDRRRGNGSRGRWFVTGSSSEQRRNATRSDRDHQDDKTRGFHTLHFPQ
jgi:hypothetical protein